MIDKILGSIEHILYKIALLFYSKEELDKLLEEDEEDAIFKL